MLRRINIRTSEHSDIVALSRGGIIFEIQKSGDFPGKFVVFKYVKGKYVSAMYEDDREKAIGAALLSLLGRKLGYGD